MQSSIGNVDDQLRPISSLVPNLTLQKHKLNVNNEIACSLRCLLLVQRTSQVHESKRGYVWMLKLEWFGRNLCKIIVFPLSYSQSWRVSLFPVAFSREVFNIRSRSCCLLFQRFLCTGWRTAYIRYGTLSMGFSSWLPPACLTAFPHLPGRSRVKAPAFSVGVFLISVD